MENKYLDENIIRRFREEINNSPIFFSAPELKGKWNLICVVMDRLDSCVKHLNTFSDYPQSEEIFINFLTFACMIKDAVAKLFSVIGIDYPYSKGAGSRKFFEHIYEKNNYPEGNSFYETRLNPPTDDKFFEYFRALAFAHPYATDRHVKSGLMQEGEIQYAPWVIANRDIARLRGGKDDVGVCVYSNRFEASLHITFSFALLKDYIKSRYELVNIATMWAQDQIQKYKHVWFCRKVNRSQQPIDILKDVKQILIERYINYYEIDQAIKYLSCKLTDSNNEVPVKKYRDYLVKRIENLCNSIDDIDDKDNEYSKFHEALNCSPRYKYKQCDYHLSKIFCYLTEEESTTDPIIKESNLHFGLKCAEWFSQEFARKYVKIDVDTMTFSEIKLLVQTACYLEKCNQENGVVHPTCIDS